MTRLSALRTLLSAVFAPQEQHLSNPPRCPVCHTSAESAPLTLVVVGPNDTIDGSTLSLPVLVCPKDGVVFAVRP